MANSLAKSSLVTTLEITPETIKRNYLKENLKTQNLRNEEELEIPGHTLQLLFNIYA